MSCSIPFSCSLLLALTVVTATIFLSSFSLSSVLLTMFFGQLSLSSLIQCGPCHYSELCCNLTTDIPHDPRSAGFASVGQCLHSIPFVLRSISFTLRETNCFHSCLFAIQHSIVYLSDQRCVNRASYPSACFTVNINVDRILAAINPNLGIEVSFIGATLVLAVISDENVPVLFLVTKYTRAQYACLLVSANPCNHLPSILSSTINLRLLLNTTCLASSNSLSTEYNVSLYHFLLFHPTFF